MQATGSVLRVQLDRGFGFIGQIGGPDLYFRQQDLMPGLEFDWQLKGRRVTFNPVEHKGRYAARNVQAA